MRYVKGREKKQTSSIDSCLFSEKKTRENPNLLRQTLNPSWREALGEVFGGRKPYSLLDLLAIFGFGGKEVNFARTSSFFLDF